MKTSDSESAVSTTSEDPVAHEIVPEPEAEQSKKWSRVSHAVLWSVALWGEAALLGYYFLASSANQSIFNQLAQRMTLNIDDETVHWTLKIIANELAACDAGAAGLSIINVPAIHKKLNLAWQANQAHEFTAAEKRFIAFTATVCLIAYVCSALSILVGFSDYHFPGQAVQYGPANSAIGGPAAAGSFFQTFLFNGALPITAGVTLDTFYRMLKRSGVFGQHQATAAEEQQALVTADALTWADYACLDNKKFLFPALASSLGRGLPFAYSAKTTLTLFVADAPELASGAAIGIGGASGTLMNLFTAGLFTAKINAENAKAKREGNFTPVASAQNPKSIVEHIANAGGTIVSAQSYLSRTITAAFFLLSLTAVDPSSNWGLGVLVAGLVFGLISYYPLFKQLKAGSTNGLTYIGSNLKEAGSAALVFCGNRASKKLPEPLPAPEPGH